MEYPIFTPTITPDDTAYEAAYQLQQLWDEKQLAVQIRFARAETEIPHNKIFNGTSM